MAGGNPRVGPASSEDEREQFFRRLFKDYYRPLLHFFQRRGVPVDICFELTQETFLRVYRGMGEFRHDASEKTWLFKIALHVWLNAVRDRNAGRRRGIFVPLEDAFDVSVPHPNSPNRVPRDALQKLLEKERIGAVRVALNELPPKMRRAFILYADEDLKYREIAVVMNVSEGTVKAHIHEARQRLKERLGVDFPARDE